MRRTLLAPNILFFVADAHKRMSMMPPFLFLDVANLIRFPFQVRWVGDRDADLVHLINTTCEIKGENPNNLSGVELDESSKRLLPRLASVPHRCKNNIHFMLVSQRFHQIAADFNWAV